MGRILSTIFADHFSNPTKPEARRRKQAQAPRLETLSIAWDGNNGFRRCWRLGWSRRGSASAVSWSLPRARVGGDLVPPTDSPHWAKCTCNRPSPLVTGPEREGAGREGERRWFGNPTGLTHG